MLPVLVIDPWARDCAGGVLAGDQPDEGADGVAGEPVPVADLDGQREPGQGADPAQAAQPAHQRGELGVGGHLCDRGVESVAAGQGGQDRVVVVVEGQPGSSDRPTAVSW